MTDHSLNPTSQKYLSHFKDMVNALNQLQIGLFQSDTLLGLHGKVDPLVCQRLITIKKRDPKNHFVILIPDTSHLQNWAKTITPLHQKLIHQFWPGPLTLIFEGLYQESIAIRYPLFNPLNILLNTLNAPLYSTSVNYSGESACETLQQVPESIKNECDFIAFFNPTHNTPSTIVDARFNIPKIIRQGGVFLS